MSVRVQLSAGEIEALLLSSDPKVFDMSTEEGTKTAAHYWRALEKLRARRDRLQRMRRGK